MNILIIANHYAVCSARYATDAFKRLGHTVHHIGPNKGRDIWGLTLPPEYEWAQDENVAESPDLVILMDSDPFLLDDVKLWQGSPLVVWGVDNHVRDYRRPYFDHYFLAHRNVSVMKWANLIAAPSGYESAARAIVDSGADMTHLPCAYDPIAFTPSPIPFADRKYDVCCLGVLYPKRVELVDAMRKAGLKVLAGTGLVYEAYRDAHHNSRIALCSSVAGDVAQRVFESAALGSVVLTDDCPDFKLLEPDGLAYYTSVQGAVEMATRLVHEPDFAQICIERSRAWVMGNSWDARAQVIVEWWEANYGAKYERFGWVKEYAPINSRVMSLRPVDENATGTVTGHEMSPNNVLKIRVRWDSGKEELTSWDALKVQK